MRTSAIKNTCWIFNHKGPGVDDKYITIGEMANILKTPLRTAKRLPKKYSLVARPAPRTSRNGKRQTLILLESLYNLPAKYLANANLPIKPTSPAPEQKPTDSQWLYLSNEEKNEVSEKIEIIQPLLFSDATDKNRFGRENRRLLTRCRPAPFSGGCAPGKKKTIKPSAVRTAKTKALSGRYPMKFKRRSRNFI